MGLNKELIGKEYVQKPFTVTAEQATKYAEATNDDNPRYRGDDMVCPPMFGVAWELLGMSAPLFDPKMNCDFARLVHGEHDMTYRRLVKPGEKITVKTIVKEILEKSSGEVLVVDLISTDDQNEIVTSTVSSYFIRGKSGGGKKEAKPQAKKEAPADPGAPAFEHQEVVAEDQSLRYADASGDHNPIHKDEDFAKSVGLPGRILHGLASMAFNQKAAVNNLCGGDPAKLKRLKVRFAAPVLMGDTLTISAWKIEPGRYTLVTKNQQGKVVIKDTEAYVDE